jgi:hypothetical protein
MFHAGRGVAVLSHGLIRVSSLVLRIELLHRRVLEHAGSLLMLPAGRLLADGALRNRRRSLSRHFFLPPLFLSGGVIVGDVAGPGPVRG